MDVILVPGLWLDGASWEKVVPALQAAGHKPRALSLPGMVVGADRPQVTLRDHVDAVVDEIDRCDGSVVLVGHSVACGVCHAAVDARPDRVARAVYIGGFPTADGDALGDGFPVEDGEIPLPDWSFFGEEDLRDLDRDVFRARAIPSPEQVVRGPQRLADERRYDVPVTAVATEYTAAQLQGWISQGMAPVREFARSRDVEYVDLPTGHWPQFTRPDDLAVAILGAVSRS
jgi:pimeloyl-ACP methyl ester carboxylesterase